MDVEELLRLLVTQYREDLTEKQLKAFEGMVELGRELSPKQEQWVYGIAEKFGITVAPARNLFSRMSPLQRKEHQAKVRTMLPWERGEMSLPKKPPGRT